MSYYQNFVNKTYNIERFIHKHVNTIQERDKIYRKHPSEMLIRDKDGNLKRVTKWYLFYQMDIDEVETLTGFDDPEEEETRMYLEAKYNNNN
jgi:valyl-tRNA synthetase